MRFSALDICFFMPALATNPMDPKIAVSVQRINRHFEER